MKFRYLLYILPLLSFSSCILKSPKYTSVDRVMTIKPGMTRLEVDEKLDLKPYDIKSINDSTEVLIYIYRVNERRTIPFYTKEKNGVSSKGKYVQLNITYTKEGIVKKLESCSSCADPLVTRTKINWDKIMPYVTATLPVILVYIGLQKDND